MKILVFVIISIVSFVFGATAKEPDLTGFKSIVLTKTSDKDRFYNYFSDYVEKNDKDKAIYRYFEMPMFSNSSDSLVFTNVFDMLACGVNNCPYKVFIKKSDGSEKQVLDGIGPDSPEGLFKIKTNGNKPMDINVGIYVFTYDEKEEKYVEQKQ